MEAQKCAVLTVLKIHRKETEKIVFVKAWPLDGIAEGFLALDENSLNCLGFDPEKLVPPQASTSPRVNKKKGKKKTTPRRRRPSLGDDAHPERSRNGVEDRNNVNTNPSPPETHANYSSPPSLIISKCNGVTSARAVALACDTNLDFIYSDEYIAMVSAELLGRVLGVGMVISTSAVGEPLTLVVHSTTPAVTDESSPATPVRFTKNSKLDILQSNTESSEDQRKCHPRRKLGGLDCQATELRKLAVAAFESSSESRFPDSRLKPATENRNQRLIGALLYGPPGTGKTSLACSLATECCAHLEIICGPELLGDAYGDGIRTVKAAFSRAKARQPSVVLLDEVDAIAPRRDAPNTDSIQRKLTGTLLTILDDPDDSKLAGIFVIGTTNRPDAIDPALRRAGRFDREIEVPIPDATSRLDILISLTATAADAQRLEISDLDLEKVASICYGFVGADLAALWRETVAIALKRGKSPKVLVDDFRRALKVIRPSGLREVAVEIPFTKWDDIGGMETAKRRLQEAVEWPLTRNGAALFASIGITPPKGILLYGPPGCSKTLLARAVATESGANFISVKGAELLSKWVGESEKAVRNIFRRARHAAPCVIFFDEIDALASSRSLTAGASAQARVVAQLLTEMDGIDTPGLDQRVVVIAATNRPDCLDSAFLRPGRIDVQIYVRLPDKEERLSILRVHTRETPLAEDVDIDNLASDVATRGFSGAELSALVREAALTAMQKDVEGASHVCMDDFMVALSQVKPRTPPALVEFFDRYFEALEGKG